MVCRSNQIATNKGTALLLKTIVYCNIARWANNSGQSVGFQVGIDANMFLLDA